MKKIITLLVFTFYCIQSNAQCFTKISAGFDYTLGIKADGTLWAWGHDNYGQLGVSPIYDRNVPVQVGTATNWQSIAAGTNHSLAIKTDGTLWAWGNNSNFQLGTLPLSAIVYTPTQVGTLTTWQSVAAGLEHSLAIKTDGSLWAWGRNNYNQLGDNTLISKQTPTHIGLGYSDFTKISAGNYHSIAIRANHTLYAWGDNFYGQLGDGTGVNKTVPTLIGSFSDWDTVDAGGDHNIGRKTGGTIWGWGYNNSGQVGDGTFIDKLSPVQLGTATYTIISAGNAHSMAGNASGLWSWGDNTYGQLGDGTTVNKTSPTQILNAGFIWNYLVAGGNFNTNRYIYSVGWNLVETTKTWGNNQYGQLGNGSNNNILIPTVINNCYSLSNETFSQNQFKIYPNPATTVLNIENQDTIEIEKIKIVNLLGEIVLTETSNFHTITIEKLAAGMYILEVVANGKTSNYKFLKQ